MHSRCIQAAVRHTPSRRQFVLGSATAFTPFASAAWAQGNAGTHRMVVGFPPGGSADTVARLLIEQLKEYAPTWIVENRAGAGGRIALEHVKSAQPDGMTMIVTPASMMVLYPHVYKNLSYDVRADFEPVSTVCSSAFSLTVGPKVPTAVRSIEDFIGWCKANPKDASYGTSGAGSMPHFAGVMLARAAAFEFVHVAYKGAAPAIQDLLGGHIAANLSVISTPLASIQAGQLRSLATTGAMRSPFLPDVPTLVEAGFKDLAIEEWLGVFLPPKASEPIKGKLNAAIRAAVRTKSFKESLAKFAFNEGGESSVEFAATIRADLVRWQPIVAASGFTATE